MAGTCPHCGSTELADGLSLTAWGVGPIALTWRKKVDTALARVAHLGKAGQREHTRPLKVEICTACKTVTGLYVDDVDRIEKRS